MQNLLIHLHKCCCIHLHTRHEQLHENSKDLEKPHNSLESCNINCLNKMCKSCKCGASRKRDDDDDDDDDHDDDDDDDDDDGS